MTVTSLHLVGADQLKKRWGWFLAMGILLVLLGIVAFGFSILTTIISVIVFGWLMIIGGVLQAIHAFGCRQWGGFFIDLLAGILYLVVGFLIVANPGVSAVALTLLIAMFLFLGGIFRIVVALSVRFHNQLWLVLHGIINVALGILIWQQWPLSGLWVIGLFVGIDMLFNGWSLIMLGLAAKNLRTE